MNAEDEANSGVLNWFRKPNQVDNTPLLKDLYQHITARYATSWKRIGTLLDLPSEQLNDIEAEYRTNSKRCCNEMLEKWLETDTDASWRKLFRAIESLSKSGSLNKEKSTCILEHLNMTDNGINEVSTVSNCAKEKYMQIWSTVAEDAWFSDQPKMFSQSMLIQHTKTGCYEPGKENMVTQGIEAIFGTLEKHENLIILIEGAPGVGKTTLMKEMVYRWSKNCVLQNFKLVILIYLRDPAVQKMTELSHLLQPFVQTDMKSAATTSACIRNLSKNGGKGVVFILDGYDEIPEIMQKDSIFVDIIKRMVLPHCAVVVSSRPCASQTLRRQVTTKIEILGFTIDDAKCYIKTAMEGQPDKSDDLTQFLNNQPVTNNFFIPSNLVIMVNLLKHKNSLPKNLTDLYSEFVCCIIRDHLTKSDEHITRLTDLPEPCNRTFHQLSKLAFVALKNNKLMFALDEIEAACPDIEGVDDLYGLLQAQHFDNCMTYNFWHFTIQEFLAAHYLSTLSSSELDTILEEKFWQDDYFNVFSFYMGLTKGQQPSFKKFLSDKETVSLPFKLLDDQLKCLRLYHCFSEAGCTDICDSIEQSQAFKSQAIDLAYNTLSSVDVMCITDFLVSSNIKWVELNLRDCCIQDHGIYILYRALCASKNVQVTTLQLSYNCLTEASSSMISDIVINCGIKKLWINGNHFIGESLKLFSMLVNNYTTLECLHMVDTKLSCRGAASIFMALANNNTLKELIIPDNNITDDACAAITRALKMNTSLVKLWMWNNPIRTEALLLILQALQANNTLALLGLPNCAEKTKVMLSTSQQSINKKRASQGCQVKLVIDFL